jgi:hypothetical protein
MLRGADSIPKLSSNNGLIIEDFLEPYLLSDSASSPNLVNISGDTILALYSQIYLTTKLSTDGGESWNPARTDSSIFCLWGGCLRSWILVLSMFITFIFLTDSFFHRVQTLA